VRLVFVANELETSAILPYPERVTSRRYLQVLGAALALILASASEAPPFTHFEIDDPGVLDPWDATSASDPAPPYVQPFGVELQRRGGLFDPWSLDSGTDRETLIDPWAVSSSDISR
jgi:hypothetical protein